MAEIDPPLPLAFRIGVTGLRALDPAMLPILGERVRTLLQEVAREVRACADDVRIEPSSKALLRAVSPLASGSDQLFAREALDDGWRLYAPLPFSIEEYSRDFEGATQEFDRLRARADVFVLDGARACQNESYEAVGRFVVDNCDLVLAIWDGQPARGRGGTADIVEFALRLGRPVWRVDSQTGATKFMSSLVDLPFVGAGDAAADEGALANFVKGALKTQGEPERCGLSTEPEKDPAVWWRKRQSEAQTRARALAGRGSATPSVGAAAVGLLAACSFYFWPDGATVDLSVMALCSAVAVSLAALASRRRIGARVLDELGRLCRAQITLAPLGRPLFPKYVRGGAAHRRYRALLRAAPPATGRIDIAKRSAAESGRALLFDDGTAISGRGGDPSEPGFLLFSGICFAGACLLSLVGAAFASDAMRIDLAHYGAIALALGVAALLYPSSPRGPKRRGPSRLRIDELEAKLASVDLDAPAASQTLASVLQEIAAVTLADGDASPA